MGGHILIVEDDGALARQMTEQMTRFGHSCEVAVDGRQALTLMSSRPFDAVVLDRMMPTLDGMHVLREMRAANIALPVIMLTALGQSREKVEGLDAGADDYIVKPVDPEELNARLNAHIRLRQRLIAESKETVRVGDLVISPSRFSAWRNGHLLYLQNIELRMLLALARNHDTVVTRSMLFEQVWNYDFEPTTNLIEVYIRRLRKKLTEFGGDDPIRTVRGIGYILKV